MQECSKRPHKVLMVSTSTERFFLRRSCFLLAILFALRQKLLSHNDSLVIMDQWTTMSFSWLPSKVSAPARTPCQGGVFVWQGERWEAASLRTSCQTSPPPCRWSWLESLTRRTAHHRSSFMRASLTKLYSLVWSADLAVMTSHSILSCLNPFCFREILWSKPSFHNLWIL